MSEQAWVTSAPTREGKYRFRESADAEPRDVVVDFHGRAGLVVEESAGYRAVTALVGQWQGPL